MLTVDPRAGSKGLIAPLQKRGLPVTVEQMSYGDVAFTGHGPASRPVTIGIEHKTLGDLIQCLGDKRFEGFQMLGMRNSYETSWLLIEGRWLVDREGYLMMLRRGGLERLAWGNQGGMQRRTLLKKLMSIEFCGGMRIKLTETREESLDWLQALYGWWVGKAWEEHGADFGWAPPEAWVAEAAERGDLRPWSGARQWARLIPGLGPKFSKVAAEHVKHVPERLALIPEEEWAELKHTREDGKTLRLGKSRAAAVRQWLSGRS